MVEPGTMRDALIALSINAVNTKPADRMKKTATETISECRCGTILAQTAAQKPRLFPFVSVT